MNPTQSTPAFFYCVERGPYVVALYTDAEKAAREADDRADRTGESHTVIARLNTELEPVLNYLLAKQEAEHFFSPRMIVKASNG